MGPSADHDDDHRHSSCGRLGDERELLGRQPEVGGVAELAGGVCTSKPAPAPDEDDRDVGLFHFVNDVDSLAERLQGCRRRVLRRELPEFAAHRRQSGLLLLQFEMRGEVIVAQEQPRIVRARSEYGHPCAGPEGQDAIVGEEHDGGCGGPPGQRSVLRRVEHGCGRGRVDVRLLEEAELDLLCQHAAARSFDGFHRDGAGVHERREMAVTPVGREFHIESGKQCASRRIRLVAGAVVEVLQAADAEIVSDGETGEAELHPEQFCQELAGSVQGEAVDLVVGRHDRADVPPR